MKPSNFQDSWTSKQNRARQDKEIKRRSEGEKKEMEINAELRYSFVTVCLNKYKKGEWPTHAFHKNIYVRRTRAHELK